MIGGIPPQIGAQYNPQILRDRQIRPIINDLLSVERDLGILAVARGIDNKEPHDETTKFIVKWYKTFIFALENSTDKPQDILDRFCKSMKEILIDSLFSSGVDETVVLGSDGGLYYQGCIDMFKSLAPTHLHNRSLINVDDTTPLTLIPHVFARRMVQWLTNYNHTTRNLANTKLEEVKVELQSQAQLQAERNNADDIDLIMQRQAERARQQDAERNRRIQAARLDLEQAERERFRGIVRDGFAGAEQAHKAFEDRNIRNLANRNEQFAHEVDQFENNVANLVGQVANLEVRQQELGVRHERVQGGIAEVQRLNVEAETRTGQLEKEVQDHKDKNSSELMVTLAKIAVCVAARLLFDLPLTPTNDGIMLG